VLSESEPVYDGDGEFRVILPDDITDRIEDELRRIFEFEK
jgi:hypothetical protein